MNGVFVYCVVGGVFGEVGDLNGVMGYVWVFLILFLFCWDL